jgi:hypothetical protein
MAELHLKNREAVTIRFLTQATTNWAEDVMAIVRQSKKGDFAHFGREDLLRWTMRYRFLAAIAGHDGHEGGRIVGMAVLVPLTLPSGQEGLVRDFMVLAPSFIRQGLEEAMVIKLIAEAAELKMDALVFDGSRTAPDIREVFSRMAFTEFDARMFRLMF